MASRKDKFNADSEKGIMNQDAIDSFFPRGVRQLPSCHLFLHFLEQTHVTHPMLRVLTMLMVDVR